MNLSIFNFNKMFKIFTIFLGLFVVYNLYIIVAKPKITMLQNQWQGNYSFAQDFIYENKAHNIIVGSSMAARMNQEFLPDDLYNLSFGGGSAITGLEIIKQSGFIPKRIYIENNVIFREKDKKMIDSLFYPIMWNIKSFIPALKEKYQPLNLIASKLKGSYGKTHEEYMEENRDENIFKASFQRQKENYDKPLADYQKELVELKELVLYFENKGVEILFFEMPIDEVLANSTKANEQREIIKADFKNDWLELPQNEKYTTSDGIHLLYKSAFEFSEEFMRDINK